MSPRLTLPRIARAIADHPSAMLLAIQLIQVLAWPFLDDRSAGRAVLGVIGTVAVLSAVYAVRLTPALNWVALVLGVPTVLLSVLEAFQPANEVAVLASALVHAPFYFYVSYALLRYLFADLVVTHDELFATGAAFTVVAWGFAHLYAAVQVLWPGSFTGTDAGDQGWFGLLYLSFTTLTSVGLSDIAPVLPQARSVVMLEQVAGVFYVALVVARMVGLSHGQQRPRP